MIFLILIAIPVCYFVYKKWNKVPEDPKDKLHVPVWKKDLVYLIQVPCALNVRTLSPFALKLETFLRAAKIPYENVYTLKPGSKGQTPYIELNGQEYPDSNLIIKMLTEKYNVKLEDQFKEEQLALAHATRVMVENHTAQHGFYFRYVLHYPEVLKLIKIDEVPQYLMVLMKFSMPYLMRFRLYLHGISRHSHEEMAKISCADLKGISVSLGEKKFFLSDEKASTIDCTLFGHLAQFLYIPLDFPEKKFMREEAKNLVDFVDRMKETFWPDWDEMCDPKCMEGKKSRHYM